MIFFGGCVGWFLCFFVSKYITSFTQKKGWWIPLRTVRFWNKTPAKNKKNGWMCPSFLGVSVSAKVQPLWSERCKHLQSQKKKTDSHEAEVKIDGKFWHQKREIRPFWPTFRIFLLLTENCQFGSSNLSMFGTNNSSHVTGSPSVIMLPCLTDFDVLITSYFLEQLFFF